MIKAGVAGDDAPSVMFPSCVGRPKYEMSMVAIDGKTEYIGDDALAKKGLLNIR